MYCPKCGSHQLSDETRFCAKCGLLLESARESLTTGNAPMIAQNKHKALSPRAKGILQGLAIVPLGIGAMFAIDIFYEALGAGMMAGLYSTLTMIVMVALLRILYALFLENGPVRQTTGSASSSTRQHEVGAPEDKAALAAATTSNLVQPHSVTEQTTRQLGSNQ
jgi:hypothetical protein